MEGAPGMPKVVRSTNFGSTNFRVDIHDPASVDACAHVTYIKRLVNCVIRAFTCRLDVWGHHRGHRRGRRRGRCGRIFAGGCPRGRRLREASRCYKGAFKSGKRTRAYLIYYENYFSSIITLTHLQYSQRSQLQPQQPQQCM
jgi:hypothetical protein